MNIPLAMVLFHLILVFFCFLVMVNRYLNQKEKNTVSLVLNLVITIIIINIGLVFGIVQVIISMFLYLMYMIIMNKIAVHILDKRDKSNTLLDELKKKIKKP